MTVEIGILSLLNPIFVFVFLFVVLYAILAKTKILGESQENNIIVSFVLSIIFATLTSTRDYVISLIPWFAILFVIAFLVLLLVGIMQKDVDKFIKPWVSWIFVIIFVIIIIILAIKVFYPQIAPYTPGGDETGANPIILQIKHLIATPEVLGGLLLLVIAAVTAWVLVKKE
ncbi:hypothetical protein COV15_02700 [Candidatus Woesearchaeota archaeon CG10_big_fil_rev_8_21_14_0_10_34_12]|nr:MAG: hypothetical protein COV15_02700 [Candidatus Woesearchaeota archaeon CG10_big_fil_rev_8_21_14_0_10_34_12]